MTLQRINTALLVIVIALLLWVAFGSQGRNGRYAIASVGESGHPIILDTATGCWHMLDAQEGKASLFSASVDTAVVRIRPVRVENLGQPQK